MRTFLYKHWWLLLIKGALLITLGFFAIIIPGITIITFCYFAGFTLFISGIAIATGSLGHRRYNYEWTWWLMEGVIDILLGLVMIIWPNEALRVVISIIAIWMILMGILQLITAINIQYYIRTNLFMILAGIAAIAGGILLLAIPGIGIRLLAFLTGILAIVYGAFQVFTSLLYRRIVIEEIDDIEEIL